MTGFSKIGKASAARRDDLSSIPGSEIVFVLLIFNYSRSYNKRMKVAQIELILTHSFRENAPEKNLEKTHVDFTRLIDFKKMHFNLNYLSYVPQYSICAKRLIHPWTT